MSAVAKLLAIARKAGQLSTNARQLYAAFMRRAGMDPACWQPGLAFTAGVSSGRDPHIRVRLLYYREPKLDLCEHRRFGWPSVYCVAMGSAQEPASHCTPRDPAHDQRCIAVRKSRLCSHTSPSSKSGSSTPFHSSNAPNLSIPRYFPRYLAPRPSGAPAPIRFRFLTRHACRA